MTEATSDPSQLSDRALLLGALTGAAAWSLFHIAGYLIAEGACEVNLLQSQVAGLAMVSLIVLLLAIPAFVVTVYAGVKTYRYWQPLRDNDPAATGIRAFLGYTGVIMNAVFALAIIVTALPLFFIEPCTWI